MSKRGSSLVEDNYVPMIGCFVAGFVVSRLMNHQDVVTGDVKEGLNFPGWAIILIVVVVVMVLLGVGGYLRWRKLKNDNKFKLREVGRIPARVKLEAVKIKG